MPFLDLIRLTLLSALVNILYRKSSPVTIFQMLQMRTYSASRHLPHYADAPIRMCREKTAFALAMVCARTRKLPTRSDLSLAVDGWH